MRRSKKAQRCKSFWTNAEVFLLILFFLQMTLSLILRIFHHRCLNDAQVTPNQTESELKDTVEKLQRWEVLRGRSEYCPEEWRPWRGKCYFVSSEMKNQSSSLQDCASRGAHLALLLSSPADLSFRTFSTIDAYWVGLIYMDKRWMWLNGAECGSPVHVRDNSPCAVLGVGGLRDWNCDYPNPWICEKPAVQLQIDQDQKLPVISINGVKLANVTNVKLQT
ncbi:killer cell lectin-like receptor subfamily B member 1B allele C [Rhinatrema bivittatum]|uniref:killer cell lectin-like receptor subfamily B member 1B allele C n=1 Tax=Rhinatrema bivittatum TaxID=194408 RepID=UPI0011261A6B|nr:killer cell lectin-like receptor subfamily B member 1B allele C [Rhinatrema bivittatum]